MASEMQAVGFQVGQRTFALPITAVHEIVRPPQITAVPQSAEYVEGVINLRGRIVPVIDLRRRFGEAVTESTRKNRILVVTIENRLVGLLADSASEVLKIAEAEIEPSPKLFGEAEHSYVAGIAKCGTRLVVLLRPDELLPSPPRGGT